MGVKKLVKKLGKKLKNKKLVKLKKLVGYVQAPQLLQKCYENITKTQPRRNISVIFP